MKLARFGLAVALAAMLTASASAQEKKPQRPGGGFGGGGFGMGATQLLGQKSVQEELKVTEDQLKKVTEYQEKQRANRPAAGGGGNLDKDAISARLEERRKADEKFLSETLKAEQKTRLEQIALQQTEKNQGLVAALRNQKAVDALKLSGDQKELLTAIGEDQRKLMGELFQGGGGGNREEAQKKLGDFRKSADAKVTKTFSDSQKAAWKTLVGEEFKGKIETPMRRPMGGGGN